MSEKLNSEIVVIGIDIGKNSFHLVGQDRRGSIVLRQKWSRGQVEARLVGEWIVADDIASGGLVEVLSDWTPSYPGYCLYYPGRRHMAASLRAFVDLAYEIVVRNRAKAS
jgi:hypothetical protein